MKSEFYIDSEDLSEEERQKLSDALRGSAEGDVPLALEVLIADEEEIRRLNREQRGIDKVTDVLSFPSMEDIRGEELLGEEHGDELDEEGRLFVGSVVICEKRAREQAEEYGHPYERELYYLAVHGAMHCLGYDHMTDGDKAQMREKEEAALRNINLERK